MPRLGLLFLLLLGPLLGCSPPLSRFEYARVCMGVRTRVVLYAHTPRAARDAARLAFAEIDRLDAMMSDYREGSELMRLCRAEPGVPVRVSPELARVLARALDVSIATDGAFDVTCGPLVALWRESRRTGALPDPAVLREARARSSFSLLAVDVARETVTLARDGMRLDLGGIAKGDAAERAVRVLERAGAARCLVALAGDVYAADAPPGQPGWRVEIRGDRTGDDAPPVGVLWLRHAGVSTTGDSEQFVEIDGVRYSHVIDPRTGLGLTDPRMVTVLAPRGMDADALAKGVCVRCVPEAATLAREFNAAFCVVEPDVRGDPARPRRITLHDPRGLFRWHTPPR